MVGIMKFFPRSLPVLFLPLLLLVAVPVHSGHEGSHLDQHSRAALEFEATGLADFVLQANEPVRPVIVELHGTPGFAALGDRRQQVLDNLASQQSLLDDAGRVGIQLLPREALRTQADGERRAVHYRFTWLMNGLVAYVPESQYETLRSLPGVADLHEPEEVRFLLNNSVDYILGDQPSIIDRRLAVYGETEELSPVGAPGHPEAPAETAIDGYEGQGVILSVIDSGLDYLHPAFGGSGLLTATPQVPPLAPSTSDNRKVIYFYNLGGAVTRDDHGHGTHVGATAAGYLTDGDTPPTIGYGDNIGPTPGGVRLHGVAPQAKVMAYPVCNAAGSCPGDVPLAIEDSASPFILTGAGDGDASPTTVPKPVADVINLSLGGGSDPASATSRVSNNAVLAGLTVVAAAGNSGPEAATVGAPCVGALVMCVASSLDPGSTAGSDVLLSMSQPDPCAGESGCSDSPPPADTGEDSQANPIDADEQQGMKTFYMSGGGPLPGGSVSSHFVHVDRDQEDIPPQVTGRIALLTGGTGAFATIVNPVAALAPEAILLMTDTQSATAVAVINDVPTFTFPVADGQYLLGLMEDNAGHGDVSPMPIRVGAQVLTSDFEGELSSFSSRGPNAHANAGFRYLKPDIAAPGSGVLAATTPDGNPDLGIGMTNLSGYTHASGTSMASPHAAGAAVAVRQRLRELGFDSTDMDDPDYLARRFEAAVLTRAVLQNTATNLRTGLGEPEGDGEDSTTSISDVGSGLTNLAAALEAGAVLLANQRLSSEGPREFTIPDNGQLPVEVDADGNAELPLPTLSFGVIEVIGMAEPQVFEREIILRNIAPEGVGLYHLAAVNNRNGELDGVSLSFRDADTGAPLDSIELGEDQALTVVVRLSVADDAPLIAGMEMMWYLTATHDVTGQRLRMPLYTRAAAAELPLVAAPELDAEGVQPGDEYPVSPDGNFKLAWSYQAPDEDSPEPIGFRIQSASVIDELFFDSASEPLVAGANSIWAGSEQWVSQMNPTTGNPAYFIPNLVEQNESLSMINPVALPADSVASLSFQTFQSTEPGFDFAHVEISANGGSWLQLGRFSGEFTGMRHFDLSPFAGQEVRIRFRLTSDLLITDIGWYVEQIQIEAGDWSLLADVDGGTNQWQVEGAEVGVHHYRAAGIFPMDGGGSFIGPFSEVMSVQVTDDHIFSDRFEGQ
jgi:subtilisin family serine protease